MAGAPSQLDLFDYKPKLNELDGKKMNSELLKGKRFAFLQKDSAVLMGSPRKFSQHGQSGMWFSDLVPNLAKCSDDLCMIRSMHTDQFNHHPGQLQMQCGEAKFGIPSTGSWINYGLGSENQNLPGYIVLTAGEVPVAAPLYGKMDSYPQTMQEFNSEMAILPIKFNKPKGTPGRTSKIWIGNFEKLESKTFFENSRP